ncbi:MAG: hypothetical protein RIR10_1571 [Planctomycetota bacterium]
MTRESNTSHAPSMPLGRIFARYVVPIAILGGALTLLIMTSRDALRTVPTVRVMPVAVVPTTRQAPEAAASDGLLAAGWIEPAPYAIEVPSRRSGVVSTVHVLEGDAVCAGDVLVSLASEDERLALRDREAALRVADAEFEIATLQRDRAKLDLERGIESRKMRAEYEAQLALAESDARVLTEEIAEATALRDEAEDERARKEKLISTGGASVGEVARLAQRVLALEAKRRAIEAAVSARQEAVRVAKELLAIAVDEDTQRPLARIALAEREAQVLARTEARTLAEVARDAAALAVERSEIRAPSAGTVLARRVTPGAHVGPEVEAPIALYDPMHLQLRCDVPLKDAGRLAVGNAAEIRVDVAPNAVFLGKITRIDPIADIQKNTVRCRIEILTSEADTLDLQLLRPEMLARARIFSDASSRSSAQAEGVAIPISTLASREGSRATVWITRPDGSTSRLDRREIELGVERTNGWIEVPVGLAAGDRIVLDTQDSTSLTVGARVRVEEVMEAASASASLSKESDA